ncbi:hypothetical protein V6U90_10165 [Micromonospora sp. CPCC 206060]|uniref:hypothetical protein n=1 Tax=Micromonospora sp. CPCC 206060 TaxID=3122406 RepID=UPI002FF26614
MTVPFPRRGVRVLLGLVAALAVLVPAAPASAHGADAPAATDYRTEVTGVAPDRPGLTVRTIEAGARLELTSTGGRTVVVLGYQGEPYLEVRPDGVYENVNSPATYLNRTLDGNTPVPATAGPTQPPQWSRIATEPVARWHDQRIQWRESAPPAVVRADPGREHRIRDWTIPLRDGDTAGEIRGTLDWVPPPDPYTWWAGILLGVLAVGTLGLLPAGTPAGRRAMAALGALSAVGGLAAVSFAVAREIDAGADGLTGLLGGLLTTGIWPLLTGLGALAAGGYALARRPAADFAVALAGICLALFAGVSNAAVLARAVAPVPWPAPAARGVIALTVVLGAGVAAAGALRLRSTARTSRRTNPHPDSVDHGVVVGDKGD